LVLGIPFAFLAGGVILTVPKPLAVEKVAMKTLRWTGVVVIPLLAALYVVDVGGAPQPSKKTVGPDPKDWDRVASKAIMYLTDHQGESGSWSEDKSPGVTGIVLTGMLHTGKVTAQDPVAEKALKFIESLVNRKAGHIAGKKPKVTLQNYVTCVNVMALVAAKQEKKYKSIIGDAVKFLKKLQWDEEEGKRPSDDFYGGAGYDSKSRPDLSNTQFFLEALKEAGISKDDPALKKALVFVSRCQNLKGEDNQMPWAKKINDGSFIYSAAAGGQTKVVDKPVDGALPGYGSMTYAGIKSLIYCGVSKNDERVKKAYEWIQKNYTLDKNPGMPTVREKWGLYYYYHSMAKCLNVLGVDYVKDAKGKLHDWRAEMTAALAKRQNKDGSWTNISHWMESDPNLVTGYALMALSYCKPKTK
jgi:squalene-hopene/tetraprenyl-beta-curcumene cyclase